MFGNHCDDNSHYSDNISLGKAAAVGYILSSSSNSSSSNSSTPETPDDQNEAGLDVFYEAALESPLSDDCYKVHSQSKNLVVIIYVALTLLNVAIIPVIFTYGINYYALPLICLFILWTIFVSEKNWWFTAKSVRLSEALDFFSNYENRTFVKFVVCLVNVVLFQVICLLSFFDRYFLLLNSFQLLIYLCATVKLWKKYLKYKGYCAAISEAKDKATGY